MAFTVNNERLESVSSTQESLDVVEQDNVSGTAAYVLVGRPKRHFVKHGAGASARRRTRQAHARQAISVTERQRYILRVRTMSRAICEAYLASREGLGFPMLKSVAQGGGSL